MNDRVSDFASELVQMAMATQRVPKLEADLDECRRTISNQTNTIQRLELKLMDRAQEITTLHSTIRQLEVARDNAELRFLECDDAKSTLERVLRGVIREAQGVLQAIAPIPEPATEPVHSTVVTGTPNVDSQTNIPVGEAQLAEAPTYSLRDNGYIIEPRDTYQGVKSDEAPSPFDLLPSVSADASSPDGTSEGQSAPHPTDAPMTTSNAAETEASSASTVDHGSEGQSADPFPASVQATNDTSTGLEASANSTATPSTDATSPSDPEPVKYIGIEGEWMRSLNPAWVSWFNRHGAPTGQ